jgi:hypothetical protein
MGKVGADETGSSSDERAGHRTDLVS